MVCVLSRAYLLETAETSPAVSTEHVFIFQMKELNRTECQKKHHLPLHHVAFNASIIIMAYTGRGGKQTHTY